MNAIAEPVKPSLRVMSLAETQHIRERARGHWLSILATLHILIPQGLKKQGPCPVCGGKDRFLLDGLEGRGTWFFRHCSPNAGDGFQLVMNVRACDFSEAVELVRGALGDHSRNSHATYDYTTGDGRLLFQVVCLIPKSFRQRRDVDVGNDDDREEPADCLIPAPPFPLEVSPSVLQDFLAQTSASLPVPVDLVAAPVLACLGAAIGAHQEIRPKATWTTTAALHIGCVADPGSLKSPALNLAAFPVRA